MRGGCQAKKPPVPTGTGTAHVRSHFLSVDDEAPSVREMTPLANRSCVPKSQHTSLERHTEAAHNLQSLESKRGERVVSREEHS